MLLLYPWFYTGLVFILCNCFKPYSGSLNIKSLIDVQKLCLVWCALCSISSGTWDLGYHWQINFWSYSLFVCI